MKSESTEQMLDMSTSKVLKTDDTITGRLSKKTLGIIGGMGSHASAWVFNRITELSPAMKDQDYLEILLHNNSNIPDRTAAIFNEGPSSFEELRNSVELMNKCNMQVIVLACMSSYYYYDKIKDLCKGEILHPAKLLVDHLKSYKSLNGNRTIGLIGSSGLIKSSIIQNALIQEGWSVVILDDQDQEKYFMKPLYDNDGVKAGHINEKNMKLFNTQVPLLVKKGAGIVVGACSEVPLLIKEVSVPFVDLFDLLCCQAVHYCYNQS